MKRARIVIAHGSPDPDWAAPLRAMVDRMRQLDPGVPATLALLTEPDSLAAALGAFQAQGVAEVEVIAALLSAGGKHLKRDIPAWVESARAAFPGLTIELRPGALGEDPRVIDVLAARALNLD